MSPPALLAAAILSCGPLSSVEAILEEADARYTRRAEGHSDARADPHEISLAIAGYEQAARDPKSAEARWKLAKALYFLGSYTALDTGAQKSVFQRARKAGEEAITILLRRVQASGLEDPQTLSRREAASALSGDADAAPSYFWAAVAWGRWALAVGKLEAARAGAARKVRDYALSVATLDPALEEGGGYRLLGRLHDQAPWIPFLTGWVSRREAVKDLRLAVAVNARNFVNRHFLAEALARGGPAARAEATAIEEGLLAEAASPTHLVEELAIQDEAKRNLATWRK